MDYEVIDKKDITVIRSGELTVSVRERARAADIEIVRGGRGILEITVPIRDLVGIVRGLFNEAFFPRYEENIYEGDEEEKKKLILRSKLVIPASWDWKCPHCNFMNEVEAEELDDNIECDHCKNVAIVTSPDLDDC